ncbi:Alpha-humulene/(-)-(E)-beta-caryophyllene synthase [Forsythia ovata]|uniref:Alpha-humulene/(-)-(E)-beta-caryophyllene synthase n=1 Tax=Forsythia ovata TaxID=205694 RepID=A0ABD1S696_9LAMI
MHLAHFFKGKFNIFLWVEVDVFDKFKDRKGKFDESLISNVQGLLSLYEASQFRVHGEDILEEALEFSTTQLDSLVVHVSNSLSTQIKEALEIPIHKTVTRFVANKFLSIYQQDESHNNVLLNFAKLDFNLLLKMHQKELSEVTRLVRTYFQEAKWVYCGYIPSLDEYMKVGMPSSTYILMSAAALAGINGELVSKEAFEWVASDPLILRASEIIGRLMNDLVGFGFEQKISAVGCYMNQNKGASKEEAFAEIQNLVTNAWKDINQELLRPSPTAVPMAFFMQVIVNISRYSYRLDREEHDSVPSEISSKKIKDLGFAYKYGIQDIIHETIGRCVAYGFLPTQ